MKKAALAIALCCAGCNSGSLVREASENCRRLLKIAPTREDTLIVYRMETQSYYNCYDLLPLLPLQPNR